MNKTKRILVPAIISIVTCLPAISQKQFFKSGQNFSEKQLNSFYSSIRIEGNTIYFIANDYNIYAYDKHSQKELWSSALQYKTSKPCFVGDGKIYTSYYQNKTESTAQLDAATGKLLKTLPMGQLETKPFLRKGILYGTALMADGGCLFAYDSKADSLLWSRFLAHGVSTQPYYFEDFIYANAESDNWVRVDYNGALLDTKCAEKAEIFVSDIPCVKHFNALTHDRTPINHAFSAKYLNGEEAITPANIMYGSQQSFVLHEDKLLIIGSKGKLKNKLIINDLFEEPLSDTAYGLTMLVATGENNLRFVYLNQYIQYNTRTGKADRILDLSAWDPHQVVADDKNVWLISRKDGLLYGLEL